MSETEQSNKPEPSKPPESRPPHGEPPKKPEKKSAGNLFWYFLIAIVAIAIGMSVFARQRKGDEVKYSDFMAGLDESGEARRQGAPTTYHSNNVYELKIGKEVITFQDKPKEKSSEDSAGDASHFYIPIVSISDRERARLELLLKNKGIKFTYDSPPSEWQQMAYLLLIPLFFIALIIFLFRRMGGAGSAMSFGRSRGKLYANDDVAITFNDVAGIEEAVHELREVVEFLQMPEKYQALGGRIPRGVLLVGPPGTGKTLLAKAVAGEAGVPFFGLSGSDFVEMFVGVGAARVRDMFHQAGSRAPAIIFIDELDALGKVRGSGMPGGHDEREQTLNALLVEMDGFSSDQSVIVMAATNRPETLDPALMRPGRFDRHVMVDRPDVKGREAILKVHAARIKMDDSVDLHRVGRMTPGFVGADLANLVNEAALLAARNNKNRVTMQEFDEGIERVVAGLEKQTRVIADDERQRIAYHECGHALVACSLPHTDPVHKISIIPRGMGLGYTLHFPDNDRQLITKSELQNRICCLLGGIITEDIVFEESSTGAQNDLQRASDIARRMVTEFGMSSKLGRVYYGEGSHAGFGEYPSGFGDRLHSEDTIREIDLEVKQIIGEASNTVREVLTNRRAALDHLARELVECEVMDADHLKRILDQYKTTPQINPGTRTAVKDPAPATEADDRPEERDRKME